MRYSWKRARVAGLVLAGSALGWICSAAQGGSYQVVVNEKNPTARLTQAELAELFLKRTETWNNGQEAKPVDLPATAAARESFSREVLGRQVTAIKSYWQQMIFSGRAAPPPEVSSDADVLRFVSENPGAVGYVAAGTSVHAGVKVVQVTK